MDPKEKKDQEEFINHQEEFDQDIESDDVTGENDEVNEQVEDFETKFLDMQDKYLRLAAEFDNYRKRTLKEKVEIIKNGGEKVISSILPVLDDMERALKTINSSQDSAVVKEGIELIYSKFLTTLVQEGLKKIDSTGDTDFDTDYHEAIALIPAPSECLKGKILDTVQNGYILNDKVIRHAKVVVGE